MNYIVIFQNHQTRVINSVYGPFDSAKEAQAYADKYVEIDEKATVTFLLNPLFAAKEA